MNALIARLRAALSNTRGSAAASVIFTMFTALTLTAVTASVISSLAATSAGSTQTIAANNSSTLQEQYLQSLNRGTAQPQPLCVGPFCSQIVGTTDTGGLKVITIEGGQDGTGITETHTLRPVTETMITGFDSLGRPVWSSPQDKTPYKFASLTAAANHSCAIDQAETAWCWGANSHGQLGDGTTADRAAPVKVKTAVKFKSLAAGGADTTCGLATDAKAWCWGSNTDGQLGTGPAEVGKDALVPAATGGDHTFTSLHLGPRSACGIDSTKTWCWGANPGNGTPDPSPLPVEVTGGHQFTGLSMDASTTCATDTGGKGWCWAAAATGSTGVDPAPAPGTPAEVAGGRTYKRIMVAPQTDPAKTSVACAIETSADTWCWGDNSDGQLGDGSTTASLVPVKVAGGYKLSAITLMATTACGVDDTSHLLCWGDNSHGQVGNGTTTDATAPVVVDPGQTYRSLAAHPSGTICGVTNSSIVKCWGNNATGAAAPTGPADTTSPGNVTGINAASSVTLGDGFACSLTARSTAFCWGRNDQGQTGTGTMSPTTGPGIGIRHDAAPLPFRGFVKGGLL